MNWEIFETIQPDMLVGIVNTALRNHADSLEDLCLMNDIDRTGLCTYLDSGGYKYIDELKQFRALSK